MPIKYEKLRGADHEDDVEAGAPSLSRWQKTSNGFGMISVKGLLFLSALFNIVVISLIGAFTFHSIMKRDAACIDVVSRRSPITYDLDITFRTQRFNGSLLKENIYRKPAGPEVDEAWEALGVNYRSLVVPADIAGNVGLLPDQVKVNEKYGGGFLANVEGLHQLHCLNLLRQALYYNFDYYHSKGEGPFKNSDYVLQKHVTHCLDIIRQQLMCTVDIGVLGQVWFQSKDMEYPEAYVDFNTKHVCRNFDAIRRWAEPRQVPEEAPPDFLQPPEVGDTIYKHLP